MSKFPVIQIPLPDPEESETHPEGAIDKYWQDLPNIGRSLVKADLRGAWVEKVTAALAEQIGLPVAGCELAQREDGMKMIASPNFLEDRAIERSGEKLLIPRLGKNYLYTPDAILSVIDNAGISLPSGFTTDSAISKASDLIAGYLIFDSWIGNIDRHAKNWGIQQTLDGRKELLPTYDHGLALGVRMPEDKLPLDIMGFSGDMYSSIQGEVGGALSMNILARRLLELRPEAANFWIDQIGAITRSAMEETFDRIPDGWTSNIRTVFATDLLESSRNRLVMLASDLSQTQSQLAPIQAQAPSPEAILSIDSTTTEDPNLTAWNALHSESGTVTISPLAPTPSEDPNLAAWDALHSKLDSIISGSNRIEVSSPNPTLSQEDGESDDLSLDR